MELSRIEGKTIEKVLLKNEFDGQMLKIQFTDGTKIEIASISWDQSMLDLEFFE